MGKSTVVPFGPQHPVLPEPIHFDLELEDEKVVKAIPSIGYVHRGLEKLVEKRGFQEYVYVAERVCGICSFGHGWGYSKAIEGLMEIEIPKRAEYLRTIWHEISRLHSHLLWAGLGADALGFESNDSGYHRTDHRRTGYLFRLQSGRCAPGYSRSGVKRNREAPGCAEERD